jgi:hypothetical protein
MDVWRVDGGFVKEIHGIDMRGLSVEIWKED